MILDIAARDARQRQVNKDPLYDLIEAIFAPMAIGGLRTRDGMRHGKLRLCFLRLSAWIADHLDKSPYTAFTKINALSARFNWNS